MSLEPRKPLRILMVTTEDPGRQIGGLGEFVRELTQALRHLGHQVKILLLDYTDPSCETEGPPPSGFIDFHVACRPVFPTFTPEGEVLEAGFSLLSRMIPVFQEFCPDIIHCNDRQTYMPFHCMPNVVFSLHLSMPDLSGMALLDDQWMQELKIDRCAAEHATLTLVYSAFSRKRLQNAISPNARAVIMPLGAVPCEAGVLKTKPRSIPRVISFFGRLDSKQKGLDAYLQGVSGFCNRWPDHSEELQFRVYGFGPPPPEDAYPRVSFMGFVHGSAREKAYQEADVVIMPSRYEPFGLVGLEALMHGCLLMAPPGLGMDEYFEPGKNGIAIASTAESVATTLYYVLSNWSALRPLILQGIEDTQKWSWQRAGSEHLRMYKAVLNGLAPNLHLSAQAGLPSLPPQHPTRTELAELLRQLLPWVDNDIPALIWGADWAGDELLDSYPEYTLQVSAEAACLETLQVYHPDVFQIIILGWLEYATDIHTALNQIATSGARTIILGLLRGPRLTGQRWQIESTEEVLTGLPGFTLHHSITLQNMEILILVALQKQHPCTPDFGQTIKKEEALHEVLRIPVRT
ncbi:glycosyltransferase family 4 protein [Spirochaeta lutea]|uniref:Glycosyltransferase subfamily 4-like N-terminal domain-containing protein n=1 Tax=Spirochaeta lutea TaxID=1480694 RepID=A0A098QZH7_9SPIO|nr:glycosyltransferase family 4 protein [Spirochaeta lutea]KGE72813.1 hypothetical protein DC28_05395 [Spirochaeta lutea]